MKPRPKTFNTIVKIHQFFAVPKISTLMFQCNRAVGKNIYNFFKRDSEVIKIHFSPMMREEYLKKNSSKAPGKFSRSSVGYKAVFKKSLHVI